MKRLFIKLIPLLPVIYLCQPIWASDGYSVQIASLSKPNPDLVAGITTDFMVFEDEGDDGLIRYKVGTFEDIDAARVALAQLQELGFLDAFITGKSPQTSAAISDTNKTPKGASVAGLEDLPEAVRRNVVYLDGELHVKKGDSFTPLDVYLASSGE